MEPIGGYYDWFMDFDYRPKQRNGQNNMDNNTCKCGHTNDRHYVDTDVCIEYYYEIGEYCDCIKYSPVESPALEEESVADLDARLVQDDANEYQAILDAQANDMDCDDPVNDEVL